MAISDVINPRCFQNFYHDHCRSLVLPEWLVRYAANHMETIPKFLNHVLRTMAVFDLLLLHGAWKVDFLTMLAALLLGLQTASLYVMLNHGRFPAAPRFLAPTEFMVGVGLGISIGGTILAFFVSLTFGRIHAFCAHPQNDTSSEMEENPCGERGSGLNAVWWWSSLVFWSNLVTCLSLAAGRQEISYLTQTQYENIDGTHDGGVSMDRQFADPNQSQQQAFNANINMNQPMNASSNAGYGGGNYNNAPDVQSSLQPGTSPYPQQLSV